MAWAVDGYAAAAKQLGDAADMVGMVVRGEDRRELKLLSREEFQHWARLARIDDGGVLGAAQRPDVVVLECVDRDDFEHGPAVLRAERGAEV